jgi:hypothetical protein
VKPVVENFVSPNEKAKSAVVAQLVRIARKARLGYDDFLYISQQARKKLGLRRGRKKSAGCLSCLPMPI